jgi:hypothetical protein
MYENLGKHQDITGNTVSPYLNWATQAKLADAVEINVAALRGPQSSPPASPPAVGSAAFLPTDHTAYGFSSTPPIAISTKSEYGTSFAEYRFELGNHRYVKAVDARPP